MQRKAAHIHESGRMVLEIYPQSVMRIQDKSFEKNLETFIHDSCLRSKGNFGCRVPYILNPFELGWIWSTHLTKCPGKDGCPLLVCLGATAMCGPAACRPPGASSRRESDHLLGKSWKL